MEDKNVEERIYDVIVIGGGPAGYTLLCTRCGAGFPCLCWKSFLREDR